MNDFKELLESALAWLFLPATIWGAGGAVIRAVKKEETKNWKNIFFQGIGGIFVANMLMPLVDLYTPPQFHYTLYFLAGWGGLAFVDRLYRLVSGIVERRIAAKFGGDCHVDDDRDGSE